MSPDDFTRKSVRVRIEGRVQGVFYRAWTNDQARQRGLEGWVRNRSDGSVEAVFTGPAAMVDDMLDACHRGPPAARVDDVIPEAYTDEGTGEFKQMPTV